MAIGNGPVNTLFAEILRLFLIITVLLSIAAPARPVYTRKMSQNHRKSKPGQKHSRGRPNKSEGPLFLFGLHTIEAALRNPDRHKHKLFATPNAIRRLSERDIAIAVPIEECQPRTIAQMVPRDSVHQGAVLKVDPLPPYGSKELEGAHLILALDQVTDPHNVGAIMRSAVAMDADAIVTTSRHSPEETGVLAKSASGALDMLKHVQVPNMARFVAEMGDQGFQRIALDSEADDALEDISIGDRVVLVLGSEGKGVRQGVRAACDSLARLDMPGKIKSLNVSNAAIVCLYAIRQRMKPL
ncbi:MAG: RNA methyltransferase [Stappiaceae bacterium]